MPVSNYNMEFSRQCTRCYKHKPEKEFLDNKRRIRKHCLHCREVKLRHKDLRTEKRCPTCQEIKPISEFCKHGEENNPCKVVWHRCRPCNATVCNKRLRKRIESGEARQDYKEAYKTKRWHKLLKNYGITQEEYEQLESEQEFKCAICLNPETRMYKDVLCRLVVDHDHNTGMIRGLLCYNCNIGLGNFKDSPESLRRAAAYLTSEE